MQSSSARFLCVSVIAAFSLSYLPVSLTPDALAQNVLPSPILTPFVAQVAAANAQTEMPASGSSVSASLTGSASTSRVTATTPKVSSAPLAHTTSPVAPVKPSTVTASVTDNVSSDGFRLSIPSIDLNDPIVKVGLTSEGAMAVPSGSSNNVGWYDGGPMPGEAGSAVLDAHVFAAFSKLKYVSVGDSIYVNEYGKQLRFVVAAVKTYALSEITSNDLFTPTSDHDLNLITCAGNLTADHSTYDHRIVVYATLAS